MKEQRTNRLKGEKSPYLLQHAHNPVHWYPWCEEAWQEARQQNKPVFLSIGYATCHWCHVMAEESFEDEEVADLLNREFVSIKVDREERPDVDAVYMAVCQALTGSGGWPLTILMTSEQKPFYAGTYLPKHTRYGAVGLIELLKEVARQWKESPSKLVEVGQKVADFFAQPQSADSQEPTKALFQGAMQNYRGSLDVDFGGFGGAPKFPTPHNLVFLLRYAHLAGDKVAGKMAEKTLESMARGGLFDHIGGGFSRYSTDVQWLVPHFEKMLYDNALLVLAYLEAFESTGRVYYKNIVKRTLDYVLRELRHPKGGFYCGQDADSGGGEGLYYLWTPEEVKNVLGEETGQQFCKRYDITQQGNFEGKTIPNLIKNETYDQDSPEDRDQRAKLYAYRLNRMPLRVDDKVLTSWNALMIAALAKSGKILGEPSYFKAAQEAQQFIEENLMDASGRLLVRWREEEAAYSGHLEDYSYYAFSLLHLYEATMDATYLEKAVDIAHKMQELFEDRKVGGYFFYAEDAEQLLSRPKECYDGALPSGNSMAALVLGRLFHLTGETIWQEAWQRQLSFLAGQMERYPAGFSCALLSLLEALYPTKELVAVTENEESLAPLLARLGREYHPNLFSLAKTAGNAKTLTNLAPFTAAYLIPQTGVGYYLCQGGSCMAPVYALEELKLS